MTLNARERFRQKAAEGGQQPLFVPKVEWRPPIELPSLRGAKEIAIDFETKEVDLKGKGIGIRFGSKAIGLSIATDLGHRLYLPVGHSSGNLDPEKVIAWARSELNEFDGDVVGAHLGYDLDYAHEWGITFPRAKAFHCVQNIETLLDENKVGEYNLDALSKHYLGIGKEESELREVASAYGFSTSASIKSNLWRMPSSATGKYAEADADRPLRIRRLQMPLLAAEGLDEIYAVERDLLPELVLMRRRGIRVDVAAVERQRAKWAKELALWQAKLKDFAGQRAELSEPLSFYEALEARGIKVPRTPKTDQPSVTKPMLERHASDPMVKVILNGRKIATLINTFVDGQILGHLVNGRVHPTWNQLKGDDDGTIARLAGANPNMQFIPKRDADWLDGAEVAPLVRAFFLPDGDDEWQRDDYCLTGDTRIVTIDGVKTMKELVKKPVPVLSSKDCKSLEFRPVTRTRDMGMKSVFSVTLEDGSTVRCTSDHKWMTLAGEIILTKHLKTGTRLSHVHDGYSGNYPTWYLKGWRNQVKKHTLVAGYHLGPTPVGYEIDHKDEDNQNWVRNNLRFLTVKENRGQGGKKWWRKATPEQRAERSKVLVKGQDGRRPYDGENNPNYGVKRPGVGGWWSQKRNQNHRVVSVEPAGRERVYHITVEGTNTYVLENGLISHNSQIEYRFLAHFGRGRGAEEVREKYRNDPKTDFHKMTARMLKVDPEDKRKRLKVKITNFGKVYGAQAPKLALMFGCGLEEASDFVEEYDRELPFVQETLRAADGWAQKRGFVVTIMNRRRRYPFWGPRRWKRDSNLPLFRDKEKAEEYYGGAWKVERAMCFTALNGKLQGSSADLIKKSIVDLKKAGVLKVLGPLLSTIHDENNASVPRTKIGDEAGREMTRIMEDCIKMSVPIIVESGRGKNWKEAD